MITKHGGHIFFLNSRGAQSNPNPYLYRPYCPHKRLLICSSGQYICSLGLSICSFSFALHGIPTTVESRYLKHRLSRISRYLGLKPVSLGFVHCFTVIYYGLFRTRLSRTSRYLEQCVRSFGLN